MVTPKKSLGQNWLKNSAIVNDIVQVVQVAEEDTVLEIGPGEGVLTEALLATGATVIAVEKDDRLIGILQQKFADYLANNQLRLIHDDILNFYPPQMGFQAGSYKIAANIPYYLTGQILRHFLSSECQPSAMTLMVQKEVAERIVAKDGKESLLSLSVKAYGQPQIVRVVARGNFQPVPKVDSAVLLIKNISKNFFASMSESRFFDTLKRGFNQKRKMLKGNLGLDEKTLIALDISPKARAEELILEQWAKLTHLKQS